ncbi:FecR domain-containing protein [Sphaerotilus sp.]|uniref:FecR domain-containing protein n=1 Tax=Sphaerotilus sp. TaxID=2093942 RepID=UPI002ACEFD60|nr:FecR domain-containing protein [Sphaerotilus sp.]MDZ7858779.1 FecR domain-containing protein [Sphaerotilus sp.]
MPPLSWSFSPVALRPPIWRPRARVFAAGLLASSAGVHAATAAPASTPAPASAAIAEASFSYTVSERDTLIALGRRFLADPRQWPQLQALNRVANPRRIPAGTVLQIPLRLMVTEPVPARVLAASGDVRGADGRPVVAGQTVAQGAGLRTGEGQATLQLVDGTVLTLRAASAVQVEASRRLPRIGGAVSGVTVQDGQIEVKAQKVPRGGLPGFQVSTPQGLLGVRGTEFRVAVDPQAEVTRNEVLEGQVATDGRQGQPGQRVNAGFGVVVDRTGAVTPPVRLLAAPDVSALPALQERPLVRFALAPQTGAVAYRGQVAADTRFEPVLQDVRTTGTELRFAGLPDGDYVLRVRAEDGQALQGLDAQHTFTLKARPEPPLPTNLPPKAVLSGARVDFAWATVEDARSYRLQLARTEDFREPVHDQRGLVSPALTLDGLAPGVYHWRLASERSATDQGPFGAVYRLELRALPAPVPPPTVGEGGVRLAWQGLPGQRFDIEFARDASFAALALARQTEAPVLEVAMPDTGRYYLRVRARDPDGFVGPYTAPQHFHLPHCLRDGQGRCAASGEGPSVLIEP